MSLQGQNNLIILVTLVKQVLFANSPCVARTAFEHPWFFSYQIGVDVELVKRLNIIRIALATCAKKNISEFEKYCRVTKKLYVKECGWYPANPTLHKIFDHSGTVFEYY